MSLRLLSLSWIPLLALALATAAPGEGRGRGPERDALFQVSTLAALIEGEYTGLAAYRDVAKRGDFGLGTFAALDGEMIALDGEFHQVRADGRARLVDARATTPFAAVTFFEPGEAFEVDDAAGCPELLEAIAARLPPDEAPAAIRVEGRFSLLQTRSVAAQSEPYPPLAEALAGQVVFDLYDVEASLVGFWLPAELGEVNAAGFHLHALTADRRRGGHVLDCRPDAVRVELDEITSLEVQLDDRSGAHPPRAPRGDARASNALAPW